MQFFPEEHPVFENPANRLTWRASCNPFMNCTKQKPKNKKKKGSTELHRSLFFLFSRPKYTRFILQAPVCVLKSHRTRWVILKSSPSGIWGWLFQEKKAPAWKEWVQAGRGGCGSLQPAGCVSCVNRSSLYPIPLSAAQRPSCHRLFAPLCVLSGASQLKWT